ncbi:exonuclease domain-containing protein [Lederbergia lenta]|uniref:DNA polymerase III subunit epsilon n=1 Tax=Lederbergia lenta TaxID=1467 RepID=A0A2X4VX05_LEDLE|nr:exonuclease domain-containing protein [Lederbergia lenta]MCM3112596.1 exonuclease domain-containing protein [Lederbergia lenta]MEC2323634.1 exonuclease domain-containing protein [Lederbergia lenta]SQI52388.1 DNA polymerase III subunit epsilon [Lederbergia lenta]
MNFVAIDFETANSVRSSVCSIGIVKVKNGKIQEELHTLINPLSEFHYYNTKIHGITEYMVHDAPTFEEFWPRFKGFIENQTIIAHNASFDIGVLRDSLGRIHETEPNFQYGCSYRIAKKVWPNLYNHKLSTVANYLSISLKHHDALEDARASAKIILEAMKKTRTSSIQELSSLHKLKLISLASKQPTRSRKSSQDSSLKGIVPEHIITNTKHPFYGANIVFTGKMMSMTRSMAAQYAVNCGATCKERVDLATNFLIVGEQDLYKYVQGIKSLKMKKAEEMMEQGYPIEIVGEQDFVRLVK